MPRTTTFLLLLLPAVPLCFPQGLPKGDARAEGFSPERLERPARLIRESVSSGEFAGIVAVLSRHGKTVFEQTAGFADIEAGKPMRPDTIVRFYSMTKMVTSAAAMILYEEGKFLLDDPVSKYIPGFDSVPVLEREDGDGARVVPRRSPVTIHQLLTHTSGLANNKAYQAAKTFDRDIPLSEMAKRVALVPLLHQPGEAWRYSMGLDVIGYLIEVWSGQTFDEFLSQRIFQPLRMKDTAFFVPQEKLGRLSKLYRLNSSGKVELVPERGDPSRKPVFLSGGGGLYSTADDYLRFFQMLANGGSLDGARILGRSTVDFMMRNHVPKEVLPPNGPNGRKGYGYGIGGAVLNDPAAFETLSTPGDFAWGGAAGTYFWIDRKNDLVGLWVVQRPPFTPTASKRFKVLAYQAIEN